MPTKIDTNLTGAAGEHLVLSRLLSRGILAAQAPRGTRKADILVNFLETGRSCLIQVKSRQYGADGGWHMSEKHEAIRDEDMYYCLVDFEPMHPMVFVVPAEVIASAIKLDHEIWLATPGKNGKPHNPTQMRRIRRQSLGQLEGWLDPYLERWDLISG
ncbi:MAG: hypothetical protein RIS08_399 [Actinomycetota bacterium]|jgi:hypothetical protein